MTDPLTSAPTSGTDPAAGPDLICVACDVPLVTGRVEATYLGQSFPVDLPHCPKCGFVWISEDLALGKMLRVEQAMEDK